MWEALNETCAGQCTACGQRDDCLHNAIGKAKEREILISSVPVGIGVNNLDENFTKVYANKGYYDILGYTEAEFLARFPKGGLDAFHPEDRDIVRQLAIKELRTNRFVNARARVAHKAKGYIWAQYTGRLVVNEEGKALVYIAMTDISELMALNERLENEHNFNNLIASLTEDAFFDCDLTTGVIRFSKNFADRMGLPEMIHNYPAAILSRGIIAEDSLHLFENRFKKSTSGIVEEELHLKLPDGGDVWYLYHYNIIHDDKGEPVRAIGKMTEVTKQRTQILELSEKARKDQLTGLFNKATTENLIKETLLHTLDGTKHALFIVDIDNFKNINDKLGHMNGDLVLAELSEGLKPLFRSDDIIGRVGGDEFFVFLKNYRPLDILYEKSKEVCKLFHKTYSENGFSVEISASIGISLYPEHGKDFDTLYKCADAALYSTKERGKNGLTIFSGQLTSGYKSTRTEIENTNLFSLATIIDALSNAVYVIDADNHEILYENKKARSLIGGLSNERRCYSAYRGESAPCRYCPITELSADKTESSICLTNHKLGKRIKANATPIDWPFIKRAYLISCTDISELNQE